MSEGITYLQHGTSLFPLGFISESKSLFKLAWPTSFSILFHQLIQPISLMFCGHLGKTELAAAAMALSVIYILTISVGRGLAFGADTFFSQTYGSQNKTMMGLYYQKSLIFGVLVCLPVCALQLNVKSVLLLIGQSETISGLVQDYMDLFMPGTLAYCWLFCTMRYLLCQNRVIANLVICFSGCIVNAVLHYGLVYQAHIGIRGSAISIALTYWLVFIMLITYIIGTGLYRETWPGWKIECLLEWKPFAVTVFSSIAMTWVFWFATEVGTFLAGLLGEVEISAYSIMFQIEGFCWMLPLGLGGACTARIGQYLGSGLAPGAITVTRVSFVLAGAISILLSGLTYALKGVIPKIFSQDKNVLSYTENLIPLASLFLLLEGFAGICVSIIRGTGRQMVGFLVILVAYYVVALPVGIPLMFLTKLGLAGLWWGLISGLALQALVFFAFIIKLNWNAEIQKALERSKVKCEETIGCDIESRADTTRVTEEEPTERTALLNNAMTRHESDMQINVHPNTISNEPSETSLSSESQPQTQPTSIELTRSSQCMFTTIKVGITFALFLSTLLVGILARVFLTVPPWQTPISVLCLPVLPTNKTNLTSTILPLCKNVFLQTTDSILRVSDNLRIQLNY